MCGMCQLASVSVDCGIVCVHRALRERERVCVCVSVHGLILASRMWKKSRFHTATSKFNLAQCLLMVSWERWGGGGGLCLNKKCREDLG